jgi:nucleotide-binding universal stress UspA family protein
MYRSLLVPVDESLEAQAALATALDLAARWDARVTVLHVDERATSALRRERLLASLPADLRTSLAERAEAAPRGDGLAFLREAELEAERRRVPLTVLRREGRAFEGILEEATAGGHDLLVMGALGEGGADGRSVGSTTERVVRQSRADVLVLRDASRQFLSADGGGILACIDGSPHSYAGLLSGIEIAQLSGRPFEATAVYDPYLHYTLFNGIVNVLSEKASKVFKFKDQEKLHEEIIDTGLAKIYQAHLEVARHVAKEKGVDLRIVLLDGKAHAKVLKHATATRPSLVIVGRIGVHSDASMDVGATTENLLRTLPMNVLVTSRTFVPPLDVRAQESVQWTPEALAKMERVPSFVRGVARTAVIRWAIERGHSIVTPSVINGCMADVLPPSSLQAMGWVAEEAAKQASPDAGKSFICSECGHAARDYRPVSCPVCRSGSEKFEAIDRKTVEALGELDRGDIEVEETFDGKRLEWTAGAKDALRRVPNGYERRRAKARIEKTARVRALNLIDETFAIDMVQQEVADTSYLSTRGERPQVDLARTEQPDDLTPREREGSPLPWTDAAWKRVCRVPEGFMRDMTREKIEEFAAKKQGVSIDLALCEEGIAEGRRMMAEMIQGYKASPKPAPPSPDPA